MGNAHGRVGQAVAESTGGAVRSRDGPHAVSPSLSAASTRFSSADTIRTAMGYFRASEVPINVVLTAPPKFDVSPVLRMLSGERCHFLCVNEEYRGVAEHAGNAGTRQGVEQQRHELACCERMQRLRRLREEKAQQNGAQAADSLYVQIQLELCSLALRHDQHTPLRDLLFAKGEAAQSGRRLWRVFDRSVIDQVHCELPLGVEYGSLSPHQAEVLREQAEAVWIGQQRDCSPANTVYVCLLPTREAYARLVDTCAHSRSDPAVATAMRDLQMRSYDMMKAFYYENEFVARHWTLVLELDEWTLRPQLTENVCATLLQWIRERHRDDLWDTQRLDARDAYLSTDHAHRHRVHHLVTQLQPRSAPPSSSSSSSASASFHSSSSSAAAAAPVRQRARRQRSRIGDVFPPAGSSLYSNDTDHPSAMMSDQDTDAELSTSPPLPHDLRTASTVGRVSHSSRSTAADGTTTLTRTTSMTLAPERQRRLSLQYSAPAVPSVRASVTPAHALELLHLKETVSSDQLHRMMRASEPLTAQPPAPGGWQSRGATLLH